MFHIHLSSNLCAVFLTVLKILGLMQYAERLPIGLEKVIRSVSPETVKQFYRKWYNLSNMAVIAVGDFSDTQVCFSWYIHFHNELSAVFVIKILNN